MAQDGYRSPPAEQPGFFNYADDRPSPPSQKDPSRQANSEYERIRPQIPRDAGYDHAQQPINDAVTSAFDKADTAHGISPDLLSQITSQITASVLQQLKTTSLGTQVNAEAPLPAPVQNGLGIPPSPPTQPTSPLPAQPDSYIPSPPLKPTEDTSPQSSFSQSKFTHPAHGHSTPPERVGASPLSQASNLSEGFQKNTRKEGEVRPKGPLRLDTGQDATLVEKAWGQLYNEDGVPTARLSQFLRGIANHIIEDYEPKNSLVITPTKMQKFYRDTAIASELYPWQVVFDDRTSSISRLFREIGVMHHLVQEEGRHDERPDIPGLTPQGFERWVTLLLRANPEQEFERLQKIVLNMPISNADNRKDRFPKEISRRLFPAERQTSTKEKVEKAMVAHCNITLLERGLSEGDSGQKKKESTQPPHEPKPSAGLERERKPYPSGPSHVASVADEEEESMSTPQPIERERQPYTAQPGGGKTYDGGGSKSSAPHYQSAAPPEQIKDPASSRTRAHSTSTAHRYEPTSGPATASTTKPRPIPIVSNGNRTAGGPFPAIDPSNGGNPPDPYAPPSYLQPRTGSIQRTRSLRNRSPSLQDPYRHSEPDFSNPPTAFPEYRDRPERDYDRTPSYRDENQRASMYEIGSSIPGRDRGRYRYEGTGGGTINPGTGSAAPPPTSYHVSQTSGKDYHPSDDERYRSGRIGVNGMPLGGTPGAVGYDFGHSPTAGTYYR